MTPFFILLVILVVIAAIRDWRARTVALVGAAYLVLFAFLPQD